LTPFAAGESLIATLQDVETTTTGEGEYAVLGTRGTTHVGLVLLDDAYTRIVGDDGDAVRAIVRTTRVYLGAPRRRRVRYRPPPGWQRLANAAEDVWLADRASLTIPCALPIAARTDFALPHMMLGGTDAITRAPLGFRRGTIFERPSDDLAVIVVA